MKKVTIKLTALIVLLAGAATQTKAQTGGRDPRVVTTAVPFLRISPDARAGAMGDVGIATDADAYSGFWNLGKTPFATKKSAFGVTYTPWLNDLNLKDVYLATAAGYYKLDDDQALSLDFRYFSLGNLNFTDQSGNQLQNFRPREYTIGAGYSRKLGAKSGLGVAVRYISSDLAGNDAVNGTSYKKGNSVAGDLHYFYSGATETTSGFNWGVTLSNLGAKVGYTSDDTQKDYIPANLGLGAAYKKVFDADNKITFALDLNKLLVPTPPALGDSAGIANYRNKGVVNSWFSSFGDAGESSEVKEVTAALGAEYGYKDQFFFRAGYFYEAPEKGDRQYFTVGAGLKYNTLGFNFAYILPNGAGVNRNPLSNTVRFSLIFEGK